MNIIGPAMHTIRILRTNEERDVLLYRHDNNGLPFILKYDHKLTSLNY